MSDHMYVCVRCGARKDPKKDVCACGSNIFIWVPERKRFQPKINFSGSVENIKMPRKGVYHINLESLVKEEPVIIRDEEGIYYINLPVKVRSIIKK